MRLRNTCGVGFGPQLSLPPVEGKVWQINHKLCRFGGCATHP
jgi:hypothetical protein